MTNQQLRPIMGGNVRGMRIAHHLIKDELSELLGISAKFLDLIERGDRGVTSANLLKLTDVFNVPMEIFFRHDRGISFDEHTALRKKIYALTESFTTQELNLILGIIKEIRQTYHPKRSS